MAVAERKAIFAPEFIIRYHFGGRATSARRTRLGRFCLLTFLPHLSLRASAVLAILDFKTASLIAAEAISH